MLWIWSGGSNVSCRFVTLYLTERPYCCWLDVTLIYSPVAVTVGWGTSYLICLSQDLSKDLLWRTQIHLIWSIWLFCGAFFFLVLTNWFFRTDYVKDDTRMVLYSCGIPSSNFSLAPEWVRKVHHWYHFPDCLYTMALGITLVVSKILIYAISRR